MSENRSEQATPRRRQKAREQGRVSRGRELAGALAFSAGLMLLAVAGHGGLQAWAATYRNLLSFRPGSGPSPSAGFIAANSVALYWLYPAVGGALVMALASSAAQGGLVFTPSLLQPKLERISPASRLKQFFSMTMLANLGKSILPTGVIAYIVVTTIARDWTLLCGSSLLNHRAFASWFSAQAFSLAWKCALVLVCWAAIDSLIERQNFERGLKMTKQEVREEARESEGNPQVKARIRKLQRQTRRKRMLEDVARAAVVITNPTHYAVALEYNERVLAPVVVAKGRNLLAQQIKQAGRWHGVPMIENIPLAHSLYRTAEVGQSIPVKLYAAVAEVLAFILRAQARVARNEVR